MLKLFGITLNWIHDKRENQVRSHEGGGGGCSPNQLLYSDLFPAIARNSVEMEVYYSQNKLLWLVIIFQCHSEGWQLNCLWY